MKENLEAKFRIYRYGGKQLSRMSKRELLELLVRMHEKHNGSWFRVGDSYHLVAPEEIPYPELNARLSKKR